MLPPQYCVTGPRWVKHAVVMRGKHAGWCLIFEQIVMYCQFDYGSKVHFKRLYILSDRYIETSSLQSGFNMIEASMCWTISMDYASPDVCTRDLPELLRNLHVNIHVIEQRFPDLGSDWLAAQLLGNQKPRKEILVRKFGFLHFFYFVVQAPGLIFKLMMTPFAQLATMRDGGVRDKYPSYIASALMAWQGFS